MPDVPNMWTACSLVLDEATGISISGSGKFAHLPTLCWRARRSARLDGGEGGSLVEAFAQFLGLYSPEGSVMFTACWMSAGRSS